VLFHSYPTNIDRIVNWRPGHVRAPKITSCMYIPFCDTIRTETHHYRQNCTNHKIEPRSSSDLAIDPCFYVQAGFEPHQGTAGRILGWVWNWTELFLQFKPILLAGYLGLLLPVSLSTWSNCSALWMSNLGPPVGQSGWVNDSLLHG